ncbi:MAG TPA: 4Fe-4S binding protein [Tepidisphaeraceae bacterium]|jgi:electron transport complex protein RnfC|nr:4Fe-4S binding protein [Tepidisphaeraceae bacterium]
MLFASPSNSNTPPSPPHPAPEFRQINATDEQTIKPAANDEKINSLSSISKDEFANWLERFRQAGILVDRHNSPNLIAQLNQAIKRPIDHVICNLLDSDPTASLNAAIGARYGQEVVAGTVLISRLVGAPHAWLCLDQRMPLHWSAEIRRLARKPLAKVMAMANDYPQADPTLLLYTLLNRRLRPGRLPTEQGVVLLDAAAAMAIGRLFLADESLQRVPLAIRDHARKLSHFLMAPMGLRLEELLTAIGETEPDSVIRAGDLLRELILPRDTVVGAGELILHISEAEADINPDACIRCGWCMEACPTRVQPAVILEAAQRDSLDLAERAGIEACVECGICSYVCPSKLPLLEGIRLIKAKQTI